MLRLTRTPLLRAASIVRFNSTAAPAATQAAAAAAPSEAEIKSWMQAIDELTNEFTDPETGYTPATSLAPPGQAKINLMDEVTQRLTAFTPTPAQQAEFESVSAKAIPLRKDETIEHVINMIMRHGKKARAERTLSEALYIVQMQLRQDPVDVLKEALDKLAPLMVTKTFKTGVAKAAQVPVPLNKRQRNRLAWKWIVEGTTKRVSPDFSVRLGEEIVSVYQGKGAGYDKREMMHKTAIAHRAYVQLK